MLVDFELNKLSSLISDIFNDKDNYIASDINYFISSKSKKIRAKLIFLFAKALNFDINDRIYSLAISTELIHNASLIHDDILDNAEIRRGIISLNKKLGNNLSVLSGDILLTIAMKKLAKCKKFEVLDIFSTCLYNMCKGEINQHFSKDKLPNINEYIKKTEYKTSELFKAALVSLCKIQNIDENGILLFANNFGIAFQIKDDLLNILNNDNLKPYLNDIINGIYTAPVLFLNEDKNINNLSKEEIIKAVKDKKYVERTKELIKYYAIEAIKSIDFIQENDYKKEIIKIAENLYKVGVNE